MSRGWARGVVCPPLRWYCVDRGMCSMLLLLQALQKWQLGFLVSLYVFFLPELALTMPAQLFLVPYSFSVFCCSRRGVPRESIAAKGPRPVSFSPS